MEKKIGCYVKERGGESQSQRRRLWQSDRSENNDRSSTLFGGITEELTTENSYQFVDKKGWK